MDIEMGYIINDNIDIIRSTFNLTPEQLRVIYDLLSCRTERLGKHKLKKCNNPECNNEETSFNSCRNRHCPKCTCSKQIIWTNSRMKEILPVDYSHIVFSVPTYLKDLFQYNNEACYNILFKSVNETFKELTPVTKANNPKYGFISQLHTWTQLLKYHPHLHCLVPEGQFNAAKSRWEKTNNKILKKGILNTTFKKILTKNLISWINKNKFIYPGITAEYIMNKSKNSKNCVYIRKSFRNVTSVIKYLSTFTNKIAITNDRITDYDGTDVTISYVDRADGDKIKYEKIEVITFLKRFCLHILPRKLSKIRYYGFLANSCKTKYLKICKDLLEKAGNKISKAEQLSIDFAFKLFESLSKNKPCPICHKGELVTTITYSTRYGP